MLHGLLKNQIKMCIVLAFLSLSSAVFAVENKMDVVTQNKRDNITKAVEVNDELKVAIKKNKLPALMGATSKGDIEEVIKLIKSGENADQTDDFGVTSLMIASSKGFISIMQILIKHGALVNKESILGMSPLFYATAIDNAKAMKLLIKHGAEVNTISSGFTPLMIASDLNYINAVKILLKNGAKVDLERDLLKTGAAKFVKKVTHKDASGKTITTEIGLHDGENTKINTAVTAIDNKTINSSAKAKNISKDTALMLASMKGNIKIIKLLLKFGASVNKADSASGSTALMAAAQGGSIDAVKILYAAGANINQKNKHGHNAIDYAEDYDSKACANFLKQALDKQKNKQAR